MRDDLTREHGPVLGHLLYKSDHSSDWLLVPTPCTVHTQDDLDITSLLLLPARNPIGTAQCSRTLYFHSLSKATRSHLRASSSAVAFRFDLVVGLHCGILAASTFFFDGWVPVTMKQQECHSGSECRREHLHRCHRHWNQTLLILPEIGFLVSSLHALARVWGLTEQNSRPLRNCNNGLSPVAASWVVHSGFLGFPRVDNWPL